MLFGVVSSEEPRRATASHLRSLLVITGGLHLNVIAISLYRVLRLVLESLLEMSISGTAFCSDGVEVITRKVEFSLGHEAASTGRKCSQSDFSSYYEIDRCIKFILDNDYQRVC